MSRSGDVRTALSLYRQLCDAVKGDASLWMERGAIHGALRELDEARNCFERAVAIRPDLPEAHCQLGVALFFLGQIDRAIECYEQAIRLRPQAVDALCNLAFALDTVGQVERAIVEYRRAHAIHPSAQVLHSIGFAHLRLGQVDEALASFREALRIGGSAAESLGNIAFALNYQPGCGTDEAFTAHQRWGEAVRQSSGLAVAGGVGRDADRRLRIGYVSGDFRYHSVAFFITAVLAHHDPERIEAYGYSNAARGDRMTERIRSLCHHWVDIAAMNDQQAAARIHRDGIDILVDLSGLTRGNRLRMFALRPAPIQVTYLGYPNTTGLEAMDYRLTDAWADPPETTDHYHTERLVRLPHGFLCYTPPDNAPTVAPSPVDSAGYLTFGSFNNMAKMVPPVIECWAQILRAVPGSRLLLKNEGLCERAARERLLSRFAALGIERSRIDLRPTLGDPSAHLDLYRQVDIALDTYPYNGTTTTCEAMWMGVPVVALAGDRHAGRVGVSLLNRVGLDDLLAEDEESYRRVAANLASDITRLRGLRKALRGQMQASTLCDGASLARDIETAYEEMWQQMCSDPGGR